MLKCCRFPTPAEAYVSPFGFVFAMRTSSRTFLIGVDGCTRSSIGEDSMNVTG